MAKENVLIVEDESIVAKDLKNRLIKHGYVVPAIASSGEDAIKAVEEHRPDLVLMDIYLKGNIDGIQASEKIHERFDTPVIYLTAYADDNTFQRAKITVPYGYILKPFEERELLNTIETGLYKHEMEKRLKESEERYRMLVENQGEGIGIIDQHERFTFANPAGERVFGVQPGGLVGRSLEEFTSPEQFNIILQQTEKRKMGEQSTYEIEIKRPDGERRYLAMSCTPRFDKNGRYSGAFVVFSDITERKRMEEDLRKLSSAVEQSGSSVIITDMNGNIEYVNPKFTQITGYDHREVQGNHIKLLSTEGMMDEKIEDLIQSVTSGKSWNGEIIYKKKNGDTFWVHSSKSPIKDPEGKFTHIVGVEEDITDRKKMEEELIQKNKDLEIVSSITSAINRSNSIEDTFMTVLNGVCDMIDADAGVAYQKAGDDCTLMNLISSVARTDRGRSLTHVLSIPCITDEDAGRVYHGEADRKIRQGIFNDMDATLVIPVLFKGNVIGAMAFFTAMPLRMNNERSLHLHSIGSQLGTTIENHMLLKKVQQSLRYTADIIDRSPDAMLTIGLDGMILSFNKSASRLLKYMPEEMVGKNISTILPDGEKVSLEAGKSYVRQFIAKDGVHMPLNISMSDLYRDDTKSGFIVTLKDLSEIAGLRIVPLTEKAIDTDQLYHFEPGYIYMFDKKAGGDHMDIFADQVKHNIQGLCITRQSPKIIRENYGLEKTPILWLNSNDAIPGENCIKPDNLAGLTATLHKFLSEAEDGLILLDGMEYLMMRNSYESLLKFIHFLNDKVMISKSRVLFCIDKHALDERQYHIMASEMRPFEGNTIHGHAEPSGHRQKIKQ